MARPSNAQVRMWGKGDEEKERAPTKHLRELIQSSSEPCRVNIFIPFTEGKLKLKRDLG